MAATLGLEEAVLLHQLNELMRYRGGTSKDGYTWLQLVPGELIPLLPFWTLLDLQRIANSLIAKGVLLSDNQDLATAECFRFAINEKLAEWTPPTEEVRAIDPPSGGGGRRLVPNWMPAQDMLEWLHLNHGVSREFALAQLEDFILYWTERGDAHHAWDNKFRQHVLGRWRLQQQQASEQRICASENHLDRFWQPGADALEILLRDGVNREFIDDAIPEFVLYWSEQSGPTQAPNSKFIAHIRRQWRRFSSSVDRDGEARLIPANWQPNEDVFDILALANIDAAFARSLLPEFQMYWQDSQQEYSSWNTKFLQHVKYHWAKSHQLGNHNGATHAGQQKNRTGSTRARSIAEDLTDRSWAS
jgi:hypothetical protein